MWATGRVGSRGEIQTWVSKGACKVYLTIIERAKILTEGVKLIFGKSHNFVCQKLKRF